MQLIQNRNAMSQRKADWGELVSVVDILAGNSYDVPTYMGCLSVSPEGFLMADRKATTHYTTQGCSSLCERLGVPVGFYKKCTPELQNQILNEFIVKNRSKEVFLRYRNERDVLRFVGSGKYHPYNDKTMITELEKHFGKMTLRNVHIDEDRTTFSVLCEDLAFTTHRKFIPGLKILNSETGCSALNVGFYLHEEVCTNGLVVPHKLFPHYRRVHMGGFTPTKENPLDEWIVAAWKDLSAVASACKDNAARLAGVPGEKLLEVLEAQKNLTQGVREEIQQLLPAYGDTALDVLSALTQVARDTVSLAAKTTLEEFAGDLLFNTNIAKNAA